MKTLRSVWLLVVAIGCLLPMRAHADQAATNAHADLAAMMEAARKEGPMTWYISFYSQDLPAKAAALFAQKYPGLSVTPVRLTSGGIFQRLMQDLRNHLSIASVFTTTGIGGQYEILRQDGQLEQYTPEAAAKINPALNATIVPGYVYPMGIGLMTIAYNNAKLPAANAPTSWQDLLDPKWKGRIAIGDPSFSGFDAAWDVQTTRRVGWQYYEKLAKNDPMVQRSTLDSLTALNAGERVIAALPDTIAIDSAEKGNPITVVYPTDGTVEVIGLTAILKGAPQPNTARLFTEFLLGEDHAKMLTESHLHTVRTDIVGTLPGGKRLDQIALAPVLPATAYQEDLPGLVERWRDLFSR